jgi:hypothetical protein
MDFEIALIQINLSGPAVADDTQLGVLTENTSAAIGQTRRFGVGQRGGKAWARSGRSLRTASGEKCRGKTQRQNFR